MDRLLMNVHAGRDRRAADGQVTATGAAAQRSPLADALNARSEVHQLQVMSAALSRGRAAGSSLAYDRPGRTSQHPVQRVHPAFNSFNFWRLPLTDPETGEQTPHPLSPEGKMIDLSQELGSEAARLILYTDLDEDEAIRREKMTRKFVAESGSPWDALRLLRLYPADNDKLAAAYEFHLRSGTGDPEDTEAGETKQVKKELEGVRNLTEDQMLAQRSIVLDIAKRDDRVLPLLIALNLALREQSTGGPQYQLLSIASKDGLGIWIYGRPSLKKSKEAKTWIQTLANGLLNASVLVGIRPSPKIRIIIHDRKSRDVASTHADGNLITLNIEEYQVGDFSIGQMMGLLAHELGVHTLDKLTLSPEELEAEEKDSGTKQTGLFAGQERTVGKDSSSTRQQDDHLTIGRAILGQKSAEPRLAMYERTMISLIEAQETPSDRKDTAAAYCLDIARIVLLNDIAPTGLLSGLSTIGPMVGAARAEWTRIQQKYGGSHEVLNGIDLGTTFLTSAIARLGKLAYSLKDQPSYL